MGQLPDGARPAAGLAEFVPHRWPAVPELRHDAAVRALRADRPAQGGVGLHVRFRLAGRPGQLCHQEADRRSGAQRRAGLRVQGVAARARGPGRQGGPERRVWLSAECHARGGQYLQRWIAVPRFGVAGAGCAPERPVDLGLPIHLPGPQGHRAGAHDLCGHHGRQRVAIAGAQRQ
ncbi:Uncharacterised protein [Bordetella pertussis]|nr:Uncharacterised protein [Bordetella pertussis]